MDDLIEALIILRKYGNPIRPTHCEHDELAVCINPNIVSEEDKKRLGELGFYPYHYDDDDDDDTPYFISYRFGSN